MTEAGLERRNKSDDRTIPHGTAGGYTNHLCSCRPCTDAFVSASMISQTRRVRRGLAPDDERHGTQNGYGNWGCRCSACTDAHTEYKREHR